MNVSSASHEINNIYYKYFLSDMLQEYLIQKKFMRSREDTVREFKYLSKLNKQLITIVNDLNDGKNVGKSLQSLLNMMVKVD